MPLAGFLTYSLFQPLPSLSQWYFVGSVYCAERDMLLTVAGTVQDFHPVPFEALVRAPEACISNSMAC